jgi:RNAse (barnase) inhibitor barstar
MKKLLLYIKATIEKSNVKYEIHSFDSGAVMIDIWIGSKFYVVQIDGDTIGLSLITEETTPFDIIPDQSFKDSNAFKMAFEKIFPHDATKKTIILNGDNFSTLQGFYTEIDNILTEGLDWKTGHNLDAFNDLLRGGFGLYEYEEPIKLIWLNSDKSKSDLNTLKNGQAIYQILVEIIKEHEHIEFIES